MKKLVILISVAFILLTIIIAASAFIVVKLIKKSDPPAVASSIEEFCTPDNYDKKVSVEGYFGTQDFISVCKEDCGLSLRTDIQEIKSKKAQIRVKVGEGANTMNTLPEKYTLADVNVRDNSSNRLKVNDKIKVEGKVNYNEADKGCNISVSKIEITEPIGDKVVEQLTEEDIAEYKPIAEGDFCNSKVEGKYVIVDAFVDVPFFSAFCGARCEIDGFFVKDKELANNFKVRMTLGSENNQMERLVDNYTSKDLKIKSETGQPINISKKVRIKGVRSIYAPNRESQCRDTTIDVITINNI